jgi:hypothetical protein
MNVSPFSPDPESGVRNPEYEMGNDKTITRLVLNTFFLFLYQENYTLYCTCTALTITRKALNIRVFPIKRRESYILNIRSDFLDAIKLTKKILLYRAVFDLSAGGALIQ